MKKWWPGRSALLHMRWAFSLFLLPVYLFAASRVPGATPADLLLVFLCWHVFAYPASNGYNSYFDRDEGSIALLKNPPKTDISLYYFSLFTELLGVLLALFVSLPFAVCVLVYGIFSKAYSHPRTRFKKYAWLSFLIVFVFQGAFIFWSTQAALSPGGFTDLPDRNFFEAALSCSCLIGASYPLTQIYQHEEDGRRGDRTLSMRLGKKGTLIFSASLFLAGFVLLSHVIFYSENSTCLYLLFVLLCPAVLHFIYWFYRIFCDESAADFTTTMRQTMLGAAGLLVFFGILFLRSRNLI